MMTLMHLSTLIFAFLLGFVLGIVIIFLYNKYVYLSKHVKQYGYSTRQQNKRLASDSRFLQLAKEEHATNDFK